MSDPVEEEMERVFRMRAEGKSWSDILKEQVQKIPFKAIREKYEDRLKRPNLQNIPIFDASPRRQRLPSIIPSGNYSALEQRLFAKFCDFNLTGTMTGRLDSKNPNLSNGPKHEPVIIIDEMHDAEKTMAIMRALEGRTVLKMPKSIPFSFLPTLELSPDHVKKQMDDIINSVKKIEPPIKPPGNRKERRAAASRARRNTTKGRP